MRIRELRASDTPRVVEFLQRYFPEEEALIGTRPEGVARLVRRIFRLDTRIVLGLLGALGRPVFHFYVVEEDGALVATTLVTYPGPAGYLSMVVVDPAYRRRGYAKALLEHARADARRRRRSFVALDVLAENAPAIALYERSGYRRLRSTTYVTHDRAAAFGERPAPAPPSIRPFRRPDAEPLVAIARAHRPAEVERVVPLRPEALIGSRFEERTMEVERAGWVVDRGRGPEAWIAAAISPMTDAAHLSEPIVGDAVEPALAAALVGAAGRWIAARRPGRILGSVADHDTRERAALEGAGFRAALEVHTLYRSVD
ncbi:MAG TPA: GNAT family N-acetyltransferase [Thermoplasmata archaeon]|jgi:ribosomal protein S18 acetylase RimI-like enzyme|nr:GNAT family N-acetyltransferase [Thermoplasmata archaeon]